MHKIVKNGILIGGGAFRNKGAEAMLLTLAEKVREYCPSAIIRPTIIPVDGTPGAFSFAGGNARAGMLSNLARKAQAVPFYMRFLALMDISGYRIGDAWGVAGVRSALRGAQRARWLGGRCIYLPQAWGPFTGPDMQAAVCRLVGLCDLCYARDRISLAALLDILPEKEKGKIGIAPDIAWNFRGGDAVGARRRITRLGLADPTQKMTVCVTPNLRVYERSQGKGLDNDYVRTLAKIVERLCRRWDAQVVLIGHELVEDNQNDPDDRVLCDMVMQVVASSLPVAHVNEYLPAATVKAIVGSCSFALSSRFHALIAALSQHVPAATIGWSHKYPELLEEAGLAGNVLDTDCSWEGVAGQVDRVMAKREEHRGILDSTVPDIKRRAMEAMDAVMIRLFGAKQDGVRRTILRSGG